MAKFCKNCGAPTDPTTKFCEHCGNRVEQEAIERPEEIEQPFQQQSPPQFTSNQQHPVYTQPDITVNMINRPQPTYNRSPKSRGVLLIIWYFFGLFGGHYFYVGRMGMGVLYLFTAGLGGIGWLVDLCTILGGSFRDENGNPIGG